MSNSALFRITVVICTADRPISLKETLASLANCDRAGLNVNVLVVNDGATELQEIVSPFAEALPLRLLLEEQRGKSHALNRARRESNPGDIFAVLDDDITVEPGWFQAVRGICHRWPQKGFFGGRTCIVWPAGPTPTWAHYPRLRGPFFSVQDAATEHAVPSGQWVSGNHFWFRTEVAAGLTFENCWLTEPRFMMDLTEKGFGGVVSPEAVAYHHIQRDLLDLENLRRRALLIGREFPRARLVPFRNCARQALLFKKHPMLARAGCLANVLRWAFWRGLATIEPKLPLQEARKLVALERMATSWGYLTVSQHTMEYRLRLPSFRRSVG